VHLELLPPHWLGLSGQPLQKLSRRILADERHGELPILGAEHSERPAAAAAIRRTEPVTLAVFSMFESKSRFSGAKSLNRR
jgi:hypothetical protein